MVKAGNWIEEKQYSWPERSPTKTVMFKLGTILWTLSITWKPGKWTERKTKDIQLEWNFRDKRTWTGKYAWRK